jgi:hypothetical protein
MKPEVNVSQDDPMKSLAKISQQGLFIAPKAMFTRRRRQKRNRCFLLLSSLLFIIFSGSAAQRGLWPPRPPGFVITQNDAPQSVILLLDE